MADYLQILKRYWGYTSFRGIQKEIIESIGSGRDTLGLMPTGGGKSVTFQVPALAMDGLCLVITPLISLMKDQVTHLRNLGIKALAIHSGLSHDDIVRTLDNCIYGDYKFLYISPERLHSELFQKKLQYMKLCFITIDEAHCISQWGYDFRPSYLQISIIRRLVPDVPVLALTATATPRVADNIQDCLGFKRHNLFRMSFERKNLSYIVLPTDNKPVELLKILQLTPGSAIVYTRSRDKTSKIAGWLNDNGIRSLYYHAGLYDADKDLRQQMWQEGKVRVMVATNAFGMGIDKPDVRLVVHLDTPDSLEAYYQEAGRAGRDGLPASAILLYSRGDTKTLLKRIDDNFPPKDYIRKVYDDLCSYYELAVGDGLNVTYEFNELQFCKQFHYFPIALNSALRILSRGGYIDYKDADDNKSRVMFLLNRDDFYRLDHLPPLTEKLLQVMMRQYGGLFTQYVYIDEKDLADHTDMDSQTVYEILKSLNQQYILHYIPKKNIPHIHFPIRRVDTDEIRLGKELYGNRKKEFAERINAVITFATSDCCRSRILLSYFGERKTENCHQCDYCQRRYNRNDNTDEKAAESIITLLSDGKRHSIGEIHTLPFRLETLGRALQWLVTEEEIKQKDGFFFLN
jgi:ATP-dependent DNA helicase RecQ